MFDPSRPVSRFAPPVPESPDTIRRADPDSSPPCPSRSSPAGRNRSTASMKPTCAVTRNGGRTISNVYMVLAEVLRDCVGMRERGRDSVKTCKDIQTERPEQTRGRVQMRLCTNNRRRVAINVKKTGVPAHRRPLAPLYVSPVRSIGSGITKGTLRRSTGGREPKGAEPMGL